MLFRSRTALGFDYLDQILDIVVRPDRSWSWKDEDELRIGEQRGIVTRAEAAAIRTEGERVLERVAHWQSPFSDAWERWRPDPAWLPALMPTGWADLRIG